MNALITLAAALAAETAEHGDGHEKVFPPLDVTTFPSQLFWLAIIFGVLLFLLAKILLPRLSNILEQRSNHIADDLDTASRMQRDAEQAQKAYEQALSDARAKAHNVAETTRASINAEIEAETATADADAAKHMAVAETKIRGLREKALSNVDDIAASTAQELAEALFGGKISAAAARKAVKG